MRIWCYYQIWLAIVYIVYMFWTDVPYGVKSIIELNWTVPQSAIRSSALLLFVSSNGASFRKSSRNIDNKGMLTDYHIN